MALVYDKEVNVPAYLKVSKVISYLVYAWVLFGIIMLVFRVFLLLFSANTAAGFTQFVMKTSADYLGPFRGIFPPHNVGETGYLDVSALFAIVVYLFVAWGISALVSYIQHKIDLSKATQQKAIDEARANNTAKTISTRTLKR